MSESFTAATDDRDWFDEFAPEPATEPAPKTRMPDPNLWSVALDSGGGYFELRPRDDLGQTFARVIDELHSQYLLGFTPPVMDGKSRKIEVKLSDKSLKAHARKGYVAPKG